LKNDLWRSVFEEYTHEFLNVLESYDLLDGIRVPRHGQGSLGSVHTIPTPFSSGSKYFEYPGDKFGQYFYRLLPLLSADGVDELLVKDIIAWCKKAWPLGSWDNLITLSSIYAEDFEDQAFDFTQKGEALSLTVIKNDKYVNTADIGPRNGGGKCVGSIALFSESQQIATADGLSVDVENITRVRLRARVAFEDSDKQGSGIISFKMLVRFDGATKNIVAEDVLSLDSTLVGKEFQSYHSHINVPLNAKEITGLTLSWNRIGGAGAGTAYVDNIQVLPVQSIADEVAPSAPTIQLINYLGGTEPAVRLTLKPGGTDEGVKGYNLYRYVDGENEDTKVKLNTGLIDNPYSYYTDLTSHCDPCVPDEFFHFHVTAVDQAGNESEPSEGKKSPCWPKWDADWTAYCP